MTGSTRWGDGSRPAAGDYDARWSELTAAGVEVHGEVALLMTLGPRSVLDAGCGTGRVAIELQRRGVDVVGVDLDEGFLDAARAKGPETEWIHGDLATVDVGRQFDVVALVGNVMIFVAPGTEATVLANLAEHVIPGGHLVAGFQIQRRGLSLAAFDRDATAAGLTLVNRYATWDRDPYVGGNYAVSVFSRTFAT